MKTRSQNIQDAFSTLNPHLTVDEKAKALSILKQEMGNLDTEAIRKILLPEVAEMFGVPLTTSTGGNNYGAPSLDRQHRNYEAAKKALYRLTRKIKL